MIGLVVGEMVDRSDLVSAHCPLAAELSQDVLTVFQFHGYILQHELQDMETHLLHMAREGEQKWGDIHKTTVLYCLQVIYSNV